MHVVMSINAAWNAVNFRSGLIRALIMAGHEVTVATPSDGHESKLTALGARFEPVEMSASGMSPFEDAQLYARYRRLFRRIRPDVFLGYTIKPNIYGSLAAQRAGAATINNISGLGTAFLRGGLLGRLVETLYRRALKNAHCVFFQNPEDRQLFLDRGLTVKAPTRLLPGSGINLDDFRPSPKASDSGPFVFLFVGRLLRDKGVCELAEAARLVRKEMPDTQFRVLGFLDAANRTAISREQLNSWLGRGDIVYLGSTDDVRPFLAEADCAVLPSYREGLPRSLLEAAAMGKPLIATDVPGCRHLVRDGTNGLLVEVRNPQSLAEACLHMVRMDEAKRRKMAEASRDLVVREFGEQIVFDAYLKEIESARDQCQ